MAAFLQDITPFYGTGEKNEQGQTLEEFLDVYDPMKYQNPCSTADIIVIRSSGEIKCVENGLKVLMIQRRNHPSIGRFALPGGFVEIGEDLMMAAKRELAEETGLENIPVEQLYTWGEVWRDPRTRIITTAYLALVDDTVARAEAGDDAADAQWMDISLRLLRTDTLEGEHAGRLREDYELILSNEKKGLCFSCEVAVTSNKNSILKETAYEVTKNPQIAFDHPRMIVQALLYLQRNL